MPDIVEDPELLRRYSEDRSEAAFTELVRRHLHFVHALALQRASGDAHLAGVAAQQVFTWLAEEAGVLAGQPMLMAWLYERTQTAAAGAVRSDRRRPRTAGTAAGAPANIGETAWLDWNRLGPVLDEFMPQLPELDREALLLRVFRQLPWDVVGAKLSMTESAAQMRVERALVRLQSALAQKGVTMSAAALEQALERGARTQAPAALVPKIANAALEAAARTRSPASALGRAPATVAVAALAVAVVGLAVAVYEAADARQARTRYAAAQRRADSLASETRVLRERLQAEAKQTQAADEDNARLLQAVTSIAAAAPTPEPVADAVTPEAVMARFRHAGELARAGRYDEALAEYLWCYDDGMPRFATFYGMRNRLLTRTIADLGRQYPPALDALRDRRDRAEQRMLANASDRDAAIELADLNDALGDRARTLSQFDKLPADDPRRATLGSRLKETLIQQRRYADAVQSRPYAQMVSDFDVIATGVGGGTQNVSAAAQQEIHDGLVRSTASDVEALAGAGDLAHARSLAARLLAYDGSDETRAILQQRLTRAGQPNLLAAVPAAAAK